MNYVDGLLYLLTVYIIQNQNSINQSNKRTVWHILPLSTAVLQMNFDTAQIASMGQVSYWGITHVDFSNGNVYDTPNHNQSIKGIPGVNKVVLQENNRENLQKEPVGTNSHPLTHPHLFYLTEQK